MGPEEWRGQLVSANWQGVVLIWAVSLLAGCGTEPAPPSGNSQFTGSYFEDYRKIQFKDNVQSNVAADGSIGDLTFTDINGNEASLKDYLGKKHVVVIVTRGFFNGSICLYCSTQTSRMLTNYAKFSARDAEVVVVFPVESLEDSRRHRDFAASVRNKLDTPVEKIPFPIVLDVALKAVDHLGIRKDLSKPATYILDKQGQTRFAYVGDSLADRPSVKALLDQLDALNKDASDE